MTAPYSALNQLGLKINFDHSVIPSRVLFEHRKQALGLRMSLNH